MLGDRESRWPYPGARWWKFDLHTHTPASVDYRRGRMQTSPRDWILDYMRAGVDCVAVTDHNSGEWIDDLKVALAALEREASSGYRPLYLFPGVEITANGGIHVLAVLDPGKGASDVATLLGAAGYGGEPGCSDVVASKAPIGVVEAILDAGGIPILAHVDGPSGAGALPGNTLKPLRDVEGLLAVEVADTDRELPGAYRENRPAWAEVLGSDSHHPSGASAARFPGSHYTWVKMARPSLEGLRLALLDGGGFSIRRSDEAEALDPFARPGHFVEAIEIDEARYMGRGKPSRLEFHPAFNVLVGGRGTGKSTVVHALRIASGRERELQNLDKASDPRVTFERFNRVPADRRSRGGLTERTVIRWTVMRDGVRHRVTWRRQENTISVEEDAGDSNWRAAAVQAVTPTRFPLRMFGQGQIAALAGENQQPLLQVIDDAADVAELRRALGEACQAFYASRARIREVEGQLVRRDGLVDEQQDVGRKLARFEDAGDRDVLAAYRQRNRQRREVDRQFEAAASMPARIEELVGELVADDLPDGLFVPDSADAPDVLDIVGRLAAGVDEAADRLRAAAQGLRDAIETQRAVLEKSDWRTVVDKARADYEKLVGDLRAEGVDDPSEYGRLVQERQRLDAEIERLDSLREERDRLIEQSRSRLQAVGAARRAVSDARIAFLENALARNRFVRIRSRLYGGNPQVVERSLRDALGVTDDRYREDILVMEGDRARKGEVARLLAGLPEDPDQRREAMEQRIERLKERMVAATAGNGDFGVFLNNYFQLECGERPELLDRLLTWFPEDELDVEYSRRGDGTDFRPIEQASAGQRSAAMLAFLLAHGEEPLVLDQPEDDLDNHLIYDLVVRQIRENKARRQLIVVTHNPNVVVNGDAEMLHVLDFRRGQCVVDRSGSLQDRELREEVCRVVEGGREAFARRYRRLGRS